MLRTLLFVAVALVGMTFGAAWAYGQWTAGDPSSPALAASTCCAPGQDCCYAGSPCCGEDGDCCTQGLDCCAAGSPCCVAPAVAPAAANPKADCCK